jgi:hypothetical protein
MFPPTKSILFSPGVMMYLAGILDMNEYIYIYYIRSIHTNKEALDLAEFNIASCLSIFYPLTDKSYPCLPACLPACLPSYPCPFLTIIIIILKIIMTVSSKNDLCSSSHCKSCTPSHKKDSHQESQCLFPPSPFHF